MRYADDRIDAVEFEGRKYRSLTLYTRAVAESEERKEALRVWKARPRIKKIAGYIWLFLVLIFFVALNGLLEFDSSPDRPLAITPWLSVPLMILSACGLFLLVWLGNLIERGGGGDDAKVSHKPVLQKHRYPILAAREAEAEREALKRARKEMWLGAAVGALALGAYVIAKIFFFGGLARLLSGDVGWLLSNWQLLFLAPAVIAVAMVGYCGARDLYRLARLRRLDREGASVGG